MHSQSRSNTPVLWFTVVIVLVFAVFARGERPPVPVPYGPVGPAPREHTLLGGLAGYVVDFFLGGHRLLRDSPAAAEDYAVRAGQVENLDAEISAADGVPIVSHARGW